MFIVLFGGGSDLHRMGISVQLGGNLLLEKFLKASKPALTGVTLSWVQNLERKDHPRQREVDNDSMECTLSGEDG